MFTVQDMREANVLFYFHDRWWLVLDCYRRPYYLAVEAQQILEYEHGLITKVELHIPVQDDDEWFNGSVH